MPRSPLAVSALLALGLLAPAGAAAGAAAAPADVAITLSPDRAGAGTTLSATIRGGDELQGRQASGFVLSAQRGFAFDPRAVSRRCSAGQAADDTCPAAARIGSGRAVIVARNVLLPGGQQTFTAALTAYLGGPERSGDLGSVRVGFSEPQTGTRGSASGRIVPVAEGPYGLELRFEGIDGGDALPPGTTVELQELTLTAGARRIERKRVTRRVRVKLKRPRRSRKTGRLIRTKVVRRRSIKRIPHDLITNPPTCRGTFTALGTVRFADGSDLTRELATRCSS